MDFKEMTFNQMWTEVFIRGMVAIPLLIYAVHVLGNWTLILLFPSTSKKWKNGRKINEIDDEKMIDRMKLYVMNIGAFIVGCTFMYITQTYEQTAIPVGIISVLFFIKMRMIKKAFKMKTYKSDRFM